MKTNNPAYGIYPSLYDDEKFPGNLSEKPYNNSGTGVWCSGCLKRGVYNWLDFIFKENGKEFYRKCTECKKQEAP